MFLNMANLLLINIPPKRVAIILIKLQSTIKKYYPASSIVFINKALFFDVMSVFAKVKG